jgi:hypothetical protein
LFKAQNGIYRFGNQKREFRNSAPKYRHHKASGQAVVTLGGQDFYLISVPSIHYQAGGSMTASWENGSKTAGGCLKPVSTAR